MSSTFQSQSIRMVRTMPRTSGTSGRSLASMITAAAAVIALVLATALPAHADRKEDIAKAAIAALIISALIAAEKDGDKKHRHGQDARHSPKVPSSCAIQFEGAKRNVTVYPESCLRRAGFKYDLPRDCANRARIYGNWDRIYSAQCLRDAGFRISGR